MSTLLLERSRIALVTVLAAAFVATVGPVRAEDVTPDCGGVYETKCEFKPATSHGKAQNIGCPGGTFFDPRKGGECWSCPSDYNRTWDPVTSNTACATGLLGKKSPATFHRTVWGCGGGQFFDLIDGGSCWSCPAHYNRSIHHVKGDSACTVRAQLTCDEGNKLRGDRCVYSKEKEVENLARAKLQDFAEVILAAAFLAIDADNDPAVESDVNGKNAAGVDRVRGKATYPAATEEAAPLFNTMSIGTLVAGNVVAGASAETGVAVDFKGSRPIYWYGGASYKFGPALSLDGGINLGFWLAENNAIYGDSHGYVFGLTDLIGAYKVVKGISSFSETFSFKKGASLAVALWFSYDGSFQGFTVTPTVSAGVDFGGYAKATTGQIVN